MKKPIILLFCFFILFSCGSRKRDRTEPSTRTEYNSLDYFKEYYGIKQPANTKIRRLIDSENNEQNISYFLDQVPNGLTVVQNRDGRLIEIKDYINSSSDQTVVLNGWVKFNKNREIDFEKSAFAYCYYENNQVHVFYSTFFKDTAAIDLRLANDSILSLPLDPNAHYFDFPRSVQPFCNSGDTLKYTGTLKSWHKLEDGMRQVYGVWFECHCK
jgi:hypothetical protein